MTRECFKKYTLVTFKAECKNIILYIFKVLNLKAEELFFFITERRSARALMSGSPANVHFWISGMCVASDFYPLTPLHEEVKSKRRQLNGRRVWGMAVDSGHPVTSGRHVGGASLLKRAFAWAGGRRHGWKNAKLHFDPAPLPQASLKPQQCWLWPLRFSHRWQVI